MKTVWQRLAWSSWFFMVMLAICGRVVGAEAGKESAVEQDFSAEFGAYSGAFVLYDGKAQRWTRFHPEECRVRKSPCSTFKVLNSLIALETGVATGPDFKLPWDGKRRSIAAWNQDQTLRSAFAVSCVWYYQALAARIGMERYQEVMPKVGYGNGDLSGGVTQFWLESSLAISPDEQVDFLRRMHGRKLPFAAKTVDTVLDIMTLARDGETVFRGKTGTAGHPTKDASTLGWFIGSVSSPKGEYFFATRITGGEDPSGRNARKITEEILGKLGIYGGKK